MLFRVVIAVLAVASVFALRDTRAEVGAEVGRRVERESVAAVSKRPLDLSGRAQTGIASFYAREFHGKKMADGKPMNPHGDNAASKSLPLGTKARVTNLETGQSAVVTIQDRGPYVKGRIVDLSPATARSVGIKPSDGLARVEVVPLELPSAERVARSFR